MPFTETPLFSSQRLRGSDNYSRWAFKMESYLQLENLFFPIESPRPVNEAERKKYDLADVRAASVIKLAIHDCIIYQVQGLKTSKEIWEKLQNTYGKQTNSTVAVLGKEVFNLRLHDPKLFSEHVDRFMSILTKIQMNEQHLSKQMAFGLFLGSLPKFFDPIVINLQMQNEMDLDIALPQLFDYKLTHFEKEKPSFNNDDMAHFTENKGKTESRPKDKSNGQQPQQHATRGHQRSNFKPRGNFKNKGNKPQAQKEFDVGLALSAINSDCDKQKNMIYLDSGASKHYFNQEYFFTDLDRSVSFPLTLANGSIVSVRGKGTVFLKTKLNGGEEGNLMIQEAFYVPELISSLYSVRVSTKLGNKMIFKKDACFCIKNGKLIFKAYATDTNCYQMQVSESLANNINSCNHNGCTTLMHRRLGHRSLNNIQKLTEIARDFKFSPCADSNSRCEICIKANAVSPSHPPVTESQTTKPLDLIVSDLCGPFKNVSVSGNKYFLTFTDSHTRFTYTYLLKEKSQAFDKFVEYFNLVSNKFGYKPKTLRTDNGSEFKNEKFDTFMKQNGMTHQFTQIYSPQSNGIAERLNRTLKDMSTALLLDSGLPKRYWSEAIMTSTYLYNRLPHKSIGTTPFELWYGVKPRLNHLRVFGSKAFTYIPKEKRDKLDCRAEEGIFVGYSRNAYRILKPDGRTIKISSAVYVDEKQKYNANSNKDVFPDIFTEEKEDADPSEAHVEDEEPFCLPMRTGDSEGAASDTTDPSEEEGVPAEAGTTSQPQVRRSQRENRGVPPDRFSYNVTQEGIPQPTGQIKGIPQTDTEKWTKAASEEMQSLYKNDTWTLTQLPEGKKAIGCRWVFTTKQNELGEIERFKARLVCQGYTQTHGTDYFETFAPVVTHTTVRTLLSLAASKGMTVQHLDVKTAFLYGDLAEEIYMKQPPGFEVPGKEHLVCKLKKSLYGLKQAARAWSTKLNNLLIAEGFSSGITDKCVYKRFRDNRWTYIVVYVDDLILCTESKQDSVELIKNLQKQIDIKDLGKISHYLSVHIEQDKTKSFLLNQKQKIIDLLDCLHLKDANPVPTPMETNFLKNKSDSPPLKNTELYRTAVGKLLYISNFTRPDIANAVSILCRMVNSPTEKDFVAVKRVARYLKGTMDYKLKLPACDHPKLQAYADADFGSSPDDRKSTSGNIIFFGGGAISWLSKKQSSVTDSSTGAECVSAKIACDEIQWLHNLLLDFGVTEPKPTILMQDNQSCIKIAENEKPLKKNIDIAFHKVQDMYKSGLIKLQYCKTDCMIADIMTKPLPRENFLRLRSQINLMGDVVEFREGDL